MKIIMQRNVEGDNGWGRYVEQVVFADGRLDYRRTESKGNDRGDWMPFSGENAAVNFIFGEFPVSEKTMQAFKNDCMAFRGAKTDEFNIDGY